MRGNIFLFALLLGILVILLASFSPAQTLNDFPMMFVDESGFNAYVIGGGSSYGAVGALLDAIRFYLAPLYYYIPSAGLPVVYSADQVHVLDRDAVLVGTPCSNIWIPRVLNAPNCYSAVPSGRGMIKLVHYNGNLVLVITGSDPFLVSAAVDWLVHDRYYYRVFGDEVFVRRRFGVVRVGDGDLLRIGRPVGDVLPAIS